VVPFHVIRQLWKPEFNIIGTTRGALSHDGEAAEMTARYGKCYKKERILKTFKADNA
jgi:hypothetical protein